MAVVDIYGSILDNHKRAAMREDLMRRTLLAALLFVLMSPAAIAQSYPSSPITIIVPVAAGGLTDIIARMAAEFITRRTGQTVVVDNRTGGGGMIGLGAMARAKPDGYTLAMAINGDIVINPFLHKGMRFDPLTDFTPIALLAEAPQMLVSSATLPVSTLQELITYAKARPGQTAYASTGVGSSTHLGGHVFGKLTGLNLNHVPYRGAAPAVNDLIAGHVQIMHLSLGPVAGQLKAGTIKALVVTATRRWSAVPDVPSSTELGLPTYVGAVWFGLFGPAGLPTRITQQINGYMQEMTADPAYSDRLRALFLDPTVETPAAFKVRIENEAPFWKQTVLETGATAE